MTTMPTFDNVVSLADWRVKVRGSAQGETELDCALQSIDGERAVIESNEEMGRYAWLQVNLPDGSDVSVLGEVAERKDPLQLAVEVRFKHLFPDHRIRLMRALGSR